MIEIVVGGVLTAILTGMVNRHLHTRRLRRLGAGKQRRYRKTP